MNLCQCSQRYVTWSYLLNILPKTLIPELDDHDYFMQEWIETFGENDEKLHKPQQPPQKAIHRPCDVTTTGRDAAIIGLSEATAFVLPCNFKEESSKSYRYGNKPMTSLPVELPT